MEQSSAVWDTFLAQNDRVEFVWLQFISLTSNPLIRMIPTKKFSNMLKNGQLLSMTSAVLHLLPGDRLAEGASPTGKLHLRPDLSTAYCQFGSHGTRAVVNVDCVDEHGVPIAECARSRLRALHDLLERDTQTALLVGFEVEVMFLRPREEGSKVIDFDAINCEHSFSSMTPQDRTYLDLVEAVAHALATVGIALEQFHAEAGPGQWEFVLPPARPLQAIDLLLRARETIMIVARSFGLRATVSTQPIPDKPCNGAHVHLSVNPLGGHEEAQTLASVESFFAGIMKHLPAVLAFSLPHDISYSRVATGIWSGGEYAAWGWENKEVALRRIQHNRFELKLVDGLSNPYLVLSAILSAGLDGMVANLPLTGGHCHKAAARLSSEERERLGVKVMLPSTLDESLAALEANRCMQTRMGDLVSAYTCLKRGEAAYLRTMDDDERRRWLIARY
ncbi:FluG family protein [Aspergillus bombycis]|uniref:FluG family protein n=1 Tax=Aspergillus bombycis TaxID=109264 RepID=A0A1F8AA66_9EURO|nr:FluG family protein [Aspergillus bombycis]OGM48265.1 FluG family protein [Aspergillus bombycis]